MIQNARVAETIATKSPIRGRSTDRKPTGLLSQTHTNNQLETGIINRAIKHPIGLARHDWPRQPRVNQANAVVIPHVGQRRPVSTVNAQGPRPSCV